MATLVALSGAHGTGKTTVIEYINKMDRHESRLAWIDDFKVSRTILAEMGLTLEQATATADLTKDYQTKVLDRKISYDSNKKNLQFLGLNPPSIVMDRSVADIYAYTRLWSEKNGIPLEWFTEFEQKCVEAIALYDIILLFPIGKIPFVDDGIRAKLETQATIAKYIEEFVVAHAKQYHVIESTSVDLRAHEILRTIKNGTKTST